MKETFFDCGFLELLISDLEQIYYFASCILLKKLNLQE